MHAKACIFQKDIIVSYAKYIAEVYSASFEGIIRKVSNQAAANPKCSGAGRRAVRDRPTEHR